MPSAVVFASQLKRPDIIEAAIGVHADSPTANINLNDMTCQYDVVNPVANVAIDHAPNAIDKIYFLYVEYRSAKKPIGIPVGK